MFIIFITSIRCYCLTGVNHGIELYPDNIEYAQEKLQVFKDSSPWYDPLTFCEPKFVEGNALLLTPRGMQYDRVYCGAGCPSQHTQLLKNLLKINGVLIMPHNNKVQSYTNSFLKSQNCCPVGSYYEGQ